MLCELAGGLVRSGGRRQGEFGLSEPVELAQFSVAFFDFDEQSDVDEASGGDTNGRECLFVNGFDSYAVTETTELTVEASSTESTYVFRRSGGGAAAKAAPASASAGSSSKRKR